MNTKELKEIESKNLLEVTGGYDKKKMTYEEIATELIIQIKNMLTS